MTIINRERQDLGQRFLGRLGEAGFRPEISWALGWAGGPLALRPSGRHDPQGYRAVTLNVEKRDSDEKNFYSDKTTFRTVKLVLLQANKR